MKFIAKHLNLIGIVLFSGFALAAGALYFHVPPRVKAAPEKAGVTAACPMHQSAQTAGHDCAGDAEDHSGCATESHGCCTSPAGSAKQLPAGHPPVDGYTVAPAEAPRSSVPE